MRVWASETQVPQDVRFASLFSASCHPHPSASPGSPRHLLHPALGTTAPESGNVTLTLPACPSGEPIPGAHAPDEGPFPALGTNHPASPSPGQCLPLSLSSPSLGRRHLSAGTHPCLPPTPSPPCFLPLLGPRCPLRLPGTPHRAHSRQPAPAPAVPAVPPTWSGSCSASVLGLPPGDGSTVQPPDRSAAAEQLRGIGFPGGGGTEARPLPRGSTRLHLDPLLQGSPPPLPTPSSFLSSRSLGPSPHPHDPLVTPLLWLGVLVCLCNSLGGAPTSPHQTVLPLRMASACLEGSSRGGLPRTLTPASVRGLVCPLLSAVLSPGLVVLGLSPPRVPRPQCTASLRWSHGAS